MGREVQSGLEANITTLMEESPKASDQHVVLQAPQEYVMEMDTWITHQQAVQTGITRQGLELGTTNTADM